MVKKLLPSCPFKVSCPLYSLEGASRQELSGDHGPRRPTTGTLHQKVMDCDELAVECGVALSMFPAHACWKSSS